MIHKIIQLRRIAVQGTRNFIRNAWLSSAATAVMLVTLTIILSAVIINMSLSDTIDDIAGNVTVSVYLNDDITDDRRHILENTLRNNDNVKEVKYVDKDAALAIFMEQNRNDPSIISGLDVTDNVLPASLEVYLFDLTRLDEVINLANDSSYDDIVDETSVNEDRRAAIDNIASAQDFITMASILMASIFAMISVLVIFNTIRMAVFTRSNEIEIMKLIGATPNYIRGPFLFEAGLYGVLAGILACVSVYSVLIALGPSANDKLLIEPTIDFFVTHWLWVVLATITLGVLIGFVSCIISMSRYLRLKHW